MTPPSNRLRSPAVLVGNASFCPPYCSAESVSFTNPPSVKQRQRSSAFYCAQHFSPGCVASRRHWNPSNGVNMERSAPIARLFAHRIRTSMTPNARRERSRPYAVKAMITMMSQAEQDQPGNTRIPWTDGCRPLACFGSPASSRAHPWRFRMARFCGLPPAVAPRVPIRTRQQSTMPSQMRQETTQCRVTGPVPMGSGPRDFACGCTRPGTMGA
jgi:hypothetical protein